MLIRAKKPFFKGLLLLGSFVVMAIVMLLPIFKDAQGDKITSLQFADSVFNSFSKGSSNFIASVRAELAKLGDKKVKLDIGFAKENLLPLALLELRDSGADVTASAGRISFLGNLQNILNRALEDASYLYDNKGEIVSQRYAGADPLQVAQAWWHLLTPCVTQLQKQNEIVAANAVTAVLRRGIEPGNNFYGIPAANVADNTFLLAAMLGFYVLYAIWYGFAIYNLFDGFGLLGKNDSKKA